jgi:hypothetical protein
MVRASIRADPRPLGANVLRYQEEVDPGQRDVWRSRCTLDRIGQPDPRPAARKASCNPAAVRI